MANIIQITRVNGAKPAAQLAAGEMGWCTDNGGEVWIGSVDGDDQILIGAVNVARKSGATFTGRVILSGTQDTGNHAATYDYVNALVAGASELKASVAATTAGTPLITTSPYTKSIVGKTLTEDTPTAGFPTLDGVAAALHNRYLLKEETDPENNGIWELTTVGNGAVAWVLTRAVDADTEAENARGQFVWVDTGTVNINSGWLQTSVEPTELGGNDADDHITFTQVVGKQLVLADEVTITKTGDTFSIKDGGIDADYVNSSAIGDGLTGGNGTPLTVNPGTSMELSANTLIVSNSGITAAKINDDVAGAGVAVTAGVLSVGAGDGMKYIANQICVDFGTASDCPLEISATIDGGTWTL